MYREYLLTYAAGTLLDHTPPPPHPPRTPPLLQKKIFQIWILCQNSLTRELKIRVVGFVLKKLLTFLENLIVPHALYFTSFDNLAYCFGFRTTPPPPHLEKNIII